MEVKNSHVRHGLQSLVIKFSEVPTAGLEYKFDHVKGDLNRHLFDVMGDYPVYYVNLRVEPVDSMVQVKGEVAGELRVVCSLCAEEFSHRFKKAFTTAFYKSDHTLKNFGLNLVNDDSDLDSSFDLEILEGEDIDLSEVIHEQIALEIPFKPLCNEACKGLCLLCGTNLNLSQCQCKDIGPTHRPFEKLRALSGQK